MWAGGNYIELNITKSDAADMSRGGQDATEAILYVMKKKYIKTQLKKLNPEAIQKELKEYGAWDTVELQDHEANLMRLLWVFAGQVHDR